MQMLFNQLADSSGKIRPEDLQKLAAQFGVNDLSVAEIESSTSKKPTRKSHPEKRSSLSSTEPPEKGPSLAQPSGSKTESEEVSTNLSVETFAERLGRLFECHIPCIAEVIFQVSTTGPRACTIKRHVPVRWLSDTSAIRSCCGRSWRKSTGQQSQLNPRYRRDNQGAIPPRRRPQLRHDAMCATLWCQLIPRCLV